MKRREFNLTQWGFILSVALCLTLGAVPGTKSLAQGAQPVISATVHCKERGRLNGQVEYQYDVTLKNNTANKQIVTYNVILLAGNVPLKTHQHSTLMIPYETLTETHYGKINEADWDRASRVKVDWKSHVQQ